MNAFKVLGRVADTLYYMQDKNIAGVSNYIESFKGSQIKSKEFLVEEIANTNTAYDNVLVIGSWNSILLWELMQKECKVGWFHFLDIDPVVHQHRDLYFDYNNIRKNYDSIVADATEYSDFEKYDLIINTSCEHMKPLPTIHGPLYALQSNNYRTIEEHINCVDSTKELKKQYNLTHILFEGYADMGKYKRFTVIGSHW